MRKFSCFFVVFVLVGYMCVHAELEKKELSLKEAIYYALKNNIDLQIEMTNPETYLQSLKINNADFVPAFEANARMSETNQPSTDFFSKDISKRETSQLSLLLSQKIAMGGTFSVQLDNYKSESNSPFATVNPSLASTLTFSLSQPLLKGFGTFATKSQIYIADNEYKKSKHQLRETIANLVFNVEDAYWNLVYAYQNLDARKKALQRSKDFYKQNQKKVEVGILPPIDILEAKADVALQESWLIQAEKQVQTSEENLKKILNMSKENNVIVPSDKPEIQKISTDFNAFLEEALNKRPDIERARLDLKNYNIRVKYARNQLLPNLQLTASYYTSGRGGDQLIWEGNPFFGGRVIGSVEVDIWDSMKDVFANLYRNYAVDLRLSIPLSLKKEKAELAQAKLNLKRALLSLKNVENTIYSEVKEVIKELETNLKLVEANNIAMELQSQKLRAEEKKFSVGLSTNYMVLQAQSSYVNAVTQALSSNVEYKKTLAKINKILVRTFKAYNINFRDFVKE